MKRGPRLPFITERAPKEFSIPKLNVLQSLPCLTSRPCVLPRIPPALTDPADQSEYEQQNHAADQG